MNFFIATAGAVFAFFFMVLMHELGHFVMARLFGVKVFAFSIGFGKAIWSHTAKSGVKYLIGILPLGGYVKMQEKSTINNSIDSQDELFETQSLWIRTAIILAGPVINIVLAVLLYWMIFVMGVIQIKPIIGQIIPNTIAARAGFQSGDELQRIGHWPVKNWQMAVMGLIVSMGNPFPVNVQVLTKHERKLQTKMIDLKNWRLDASQPDVLKNFGIKPLQLKIKSIDTTVLAKEQYSWIGAWVPASQQVWRLVIFHFIVIKQMFLGRISLNILGGPIAVFQTAGMASLAGFKVYISFLAFVSLVLGVLNLLPIPGLDGGYLLFHVIEALIRKPLPAKLQMILTIFGMGFLVFVMVYATLNDLIRLVLRY